MSNCLWFPLLIFCLWIIIMWHSMATIEIPSDGLQYSIDKHRPSTSDRIVPSWRLNFHCWRWESSLDEGKQSAITIVADALRNYDDQTETLFPWRHNLSWLTEVTSGFVSVDKVAALILVRSQPINNGTLLILQREKWVIYSASLIPPLPISSTKERKRGCEGLFYYQDYSNHLVLLYQQIHYSRKRYWLMTTVK